MTTLPPGRDVLVVGDINLDVLVHPVRPIEYGTDVPARITRRPGGAGANVAVRLARLGRSVTLAGCVGRDDAGVAVTEPLAAEGVRLAVRTVSSLPTGAIVAIVDPAGQRSFASDRGANLEFSPSDLSAELIREHRHLHVSGYTLFEPGPRSAAKHAIGTALRLGRTVSIDPASAGPLREYGVAAFIADTNGVTVLLPNSEEARALAGIDESATDETESDEAANPSHTSAARAARMLTQSYPIVAVSCGAAGALWADRHTVLRRPSVRPPGPVLDTTGAGDAFTAGVLSTWLTGGDPRSCLEGGLRAAAATVSQVGAQ